VSAYIDPQMNEILRRIRSEPAVDVEALSIDEARELADAATIPWSEGAPGIASRNLAIKSGTHLLRARLYQPSVSENLPVIVFVHGGGWTFGSIDTHDGTMRHLAVESGCAVFGVDYRLAPEHPFPAALDDILASISFVEQGGLGDGFSTSSVAIAGDSAGATLALSALIARRDEGHKALRGAALFYGCYAPDFTTRSHAAFGGGDYLLTTAKMQWYWRNFLGDEPEDTTSLAAPSRADLSGLPPLYLSAAGLDPLRDDTLFLAARLAEAGVSFRCDHFPGVVHGCLRMSRELDAARDMIVAGGTYLASYLNEKITGGLEPWNVANSSS
jgi:acetyl esterase